MKNKILYNVFFLLVLVVINFSFQHCSKNENEKDYIIQQDDTSYVYKGDHYYLYLSSTNSDTSWWNKLKSLNINLS